MATSTFYPIIYACFVHGFRQMNLEAGASRYLLTIVTYLVAATIYAVGYLDHIDDITGQRAKLTIDDDF